MLSEHLHAGRSSSSLWPPSISVGGYRRSVSELRGIEGAPSPSARPDGKDGTACCNGNQLQRGQSGEVTPRWEEKSFLPADRKLLTSPWHTLIWSMTHETEFLSLWKQKLKELHQVSCSVRGTLIRGTLIRGTLIRGTLIRGTLIRGTLIRGTLIRGTLIRADVSHQHWLQSSDLPWTWWKPRMNEVLLHHRSSSEHHHQPPHLYLHPQLHIMLHSPNLRRGKSELWTAHQQLHI